MAIVITIDGPAGAGKTTTARGVSGELGYHYLDTGALYRGFAVIALRAGINDAASPRLLEALHGVAVEAVWDDKGMRVLVDGEDVTHELRRPEVTKLVSPLSAIPEFRDRLMPVQRAAAKLGGLVVDGRDTGSVVFPNADLKIFLVADVHERALRRSRELAASGVDHKVKEVQREIAERDARDSSREVAPLVFPDGGIRIDTTGLSIGDQIERIVALARERGA